VHGWEQRNKGVSCYLSCDEQFESVSETIQTAFYRIVQECLTNISKHASASIVEISCVCLKAGIQLEMNDNGEGFDEAEKTEGFGLAGIQERVESLQGTYQLKTKKGEGTNVCIFVPFGEGDAK
jgi:two-component system sensor histidine kinase UhpB